MKVLIAEDDRCSRTTLEATLTEWGYEVVTASDGLAAWEVLRQEDAPRLVVLDWVMPGLDGLELCRRVRASAELAWTYLIVLTVRAGTENVVAGLEAGADDYFVKPIEWAQLRARLRVGERTLGLQQALADRVQELNEALASVKHLQGLLPICAYCKKIRDDRNYWQQLESYITDHSEARFSHGICPDCMKGVMQQLSDAPHPPPDESGAAD
jgi:phosphoserine phosphatase RsbU/P